MSIYFLIIKGIVVIPTIAIILFQFVLPYRPVLGTVCELKPEEGTRHRYFVSFTYTGKDGQSYTATGTTCRKYPLYQERRFFVHKRKPTIGVAPEAFWEIGILCAILILCLIFM